MGYSLEPYADVVPSALKCATCGLVLQDAVVSCDRHFICGPCFSGRTRCPEPGCDMRRCERYVRAKTVDKLVRLLRYKCKFSRNGCLESGRSDWLPSHTAECHVRDRPCKLGCGEMVAPFASKRREHCDTTCMKQKIPCPDGCDVKPFPREDRWTHRQICPKEQVTCQRWGCRATYERGQAKEHDDTVCLEVEISCPQGCGSRFRRANCESHGDECASWRCTVTPDCPTRSKKAHLAEHEADCKKRTEEAQRAARELDEMKKKFEELEKKFKSQQVNTALAAPCASPAPLAEDAAGSAPPEARSSTTAVKDEAAPSSQDDSDDDALDAADDSAAADEPENPLFRQRRTTSASPAGSVKSETSGREPSSAQASSAAHEGEDEEEGASAQEDEDDGASRQEDEEERASVQEDEEEGASAEEDEDEGASVQMDEEEGASAEEHVSESGSDDGADAALDDQLSDLPSSHGSEAESEAESEQAHEPVRKKRRILQIAEESDSDE